MNSRPGEGAPVSEGGARAWAAGSILAGLYLALLAAIGTPATATAPAADAIANVPATATYADALFHAKGCIGCHSMTRRGLLSKVDAGPDLSDLARTAATRRPGMTAARYVGESLRQPAAFLAPADGNANVDMPVLGLSDAEIAALTAFLLSTP